MNTQAVADLLAGKEPVRVLVLASEKKLQNWLIWDYL